MDLHLKSIDWFLSGGNVERKYSKCPHIENIRDEAKISQQKGITKI